MPELVSLTIALVVTLGVPLALGRAFGPGSLGSTWWAGFLIATVPLIVLHGVGMPHGLSLGALTVGVILAVWQWRRTPDPGPWTRGLVAFHCLIALLVLIAALDTFAQPVVEWDAVVMWWPKARDLMDWRPLAELMRPNYPDLGPMAWSIVTTAAGGLEPAGRVVLPIAAIMALAALADLAKRPLDVSMTLVLGTLAVVFYGTHEFTSGYQDALLAAGIGISVISLAVSFSTSGHGVLQGFATAGALGLIKSEGLPIGAGIVLAYTLVTLATTPGTGRRVVMRTLRKPAACFAALAALWPLLLLWHGISVAELQEGSFTVDGLLAIPGRLGERLPVIGRHVALLAGDPARLAIIAITGVLAIGVVLGLQRAWPRDARQRLALFALVGAFHLVFVIVVFLATEVPLAWHLDTALLRLLLHMRFVLAASVTVVLFELLDVHRA